MNDLSATFHNQVFHSDVMEVMQSLPDNCIDLVYADPDYNVGINYGGVRYTKAWSEYIAWYSQLITESMRILKDTGNLFTINYPRQNAFLRVKCLEDIAHSVHEYVWTYNTNVGHSNRRFTTAHRSILHATKSKNNAFYKSQVAQPYKNPDDRRIKERIALGSKGRMPYSWFYFDLVKNVSKDKTVHACQIPLKLVEMLYNATTKPDDLIFVLFGGSGSELMLAKNMKRNFISCEMHKPYYDLIQDRLHADGENRIKKSRKVRNRATGKRTDSSVSESR